MPNSAFLTREFVVVDDTDSPKSPSKRDLFHAEEPAPLSQQQLQTLYGPTPASQRPVWAQQPQQNPSWSASYTCQQGAVQAPFFRNKSQSLTTLDLEEADVPFLKRQ